MKSNGSDAPSECQSSLDIPDWVREPAIRDKLMSLAAGLAQEEEPKRAYRADADGSEYHTPTRLSPTALRNEATQLRLKGNAHLLIEAKALEFDADEFEVKFGFEIEKWGAQGFAARIFLEQAYRNAMHNHPIILHEAYNIVDSMRSQCAALKTLAKQLNAFGHSKTAKTLVRWSVQLGSEADLLSSWLDGTIDRTDDGQPMIAEPGVFERRTPNSDIRAFACSMAITIKSVFGKDIMIGTITHILQRCVQSGRSAVIRQRGLEGLL